jgi:hypothetical protein
MGIGSRFDAGTIAEPAGPPRKTCAIAPVALSTPGVPVVAGCAIAVAGLVAAFAGRTALLGAECGISTGMLCGVRLVGAGPATGADVGSPSLCFTAASDAAVLRLLRGLTGTASVAPDAFSAEPVPRVGASIVFPAGCTTGAAIDAFGPGAVAAIASLRPSIDPAREAIVCASAAEIGFAGASDRVVASCGAVAVVPATFVTFFVIACCAVDLLAWVCGPVAAFAATDAGAEAGARGPSVASRDPSLDSSLFGADGSSAGVERLIGFGSWVLTAGPASELFVAVARSAPRFLSPSPFSGTASGRAVCGAGTTVRCCNINSPKASPFATAAWRVLIPGSGSPLSPCNPTTGNAALECTASSSVRNCSRKWADRRRVR